MYQCILNVPPWNDWSKITYWQVHGSPRLKVLLIKSLNKISVTFAELIQFGQYQKLRRPRTFWRKILSFIEERFRIFTIYIYIYIPIYIYILYKPIYIYYICIYITQQRDIYKTVIIRSLQIFYKSSFVS